MLNTNVCDRCGKYCISRSMSFLNLEMICHECRKEERGLDVYHIAREVEEVGFLNKSILDMPGIKKIGITGEGLVVTFNGIPMLLTMSSTGKIVYGYTLGSDMKTPITFDEAKLITQFGQLKS